MTDSSSIWFYRQLLDICLLRSNCTFNKCLVTLWGKMVYTFWGTTKSEKGEHWQEKQRRRGKKMKFDWSLIENPFKQDTKISKMRQKNCYWVNMLLPKRTEQHKPMNAHSALQRSTLVQTLVIQKFYKFYSRWADKQCLQNEKSLI